MSVQNATNKKMKKCNDVLFLPHIKAYCSSRYSMEYSEHYKIYKKFCGD